MPEIYPLASLEARIHHPYPWAGSQVWAGLCSSQGLQGRVLPVSSGFWWPQASLVFLGSAVLSPLRWYQPWQRQTLTPAGKAPW